MATKKSTSDQDGARSATAGNGRSETIIAAALTLFGSKGYVATTTKEIGDAVGIDNSSLYYYIDSKEALLYRIAMSVHEPGLERAAEIKAEGGDEVSQLRRLITDHLMRFAENVEATRVCYADWQHLRGEHLEEIRERRAEYGRFVQSLIIAGQRKGSFNAALDPAVATHAVISLLNSLNVWYDPAQDTPIETITENYLAIIFSGLAG